MIGTINQFFVTVKKGMPDGHSGCTKDAFLSGYGLSGCGITVIFLLLMTMPTIAYYRGGIDAKDKQMFYTDKDKQNIAYIQISGNDAIGVEYNQIDKTLTGNIIISKNPPENGGLQVSKQKIGPLKPMK